MKQSKRAILTTHTGSLPRPPEMLARLADGATDIDRHNVYDTQAREAVAQAVKRQAGLGISIVNDGEQSKPSYATYVKDRLTGFDGTTQSRDPARIDVAEFPGFHSHTSIQAVHRPTCSGPISWKDWEAVERDIAHFKAALNQINVEEAFMTAASPGVIARFLHNEYFPSEEAYLYAVAEVMKDEYEAIAAAGLVLQVDCPDLASSRSDIFAHLSLEEFRKVVVLHLEVLDYALSRIPPEQVRLHLCWGNYEGPHHRDIPLKDIIDLVLRARPAGISFPGANSRHEHEWKVWGEISVPDGKIIIPGVIDTTTNFIEHPEVVAQRIARYADMVGREKVIASTDCGLSTFAGGSRVDPDIAWHKLGSLVEGARLATEELWPR